jgi:hypothetical protein
MNESEIIEGKFEESLATIPHVEIAMSIAREPEVVLAEARRAAKALQEVIESKPDKVVFNKKTYLTYEDWQTVARFYGVSAKVVSSTFVQYGDVRGFESRAVAVLVSNGVEVSAAEAMCLNDEENWGMRTKYEWQDVLDEHGNKIWEFNEKKGKKLPKSKRVKVGEEPTPLFQLRSMAQTRACAKALRNILAFVPVLAGYAPTPAEEMTYRGSQEAAQEVAAQRMKEMQAKIDAQKKSQPPVTVPRATISLPEIAKKLEAGTHPDQQPIKQDPKLITPAQRKRFFAIWKSHGWSEEQVRDILKQDFALHSTADITKSQYEKVCKRFEVDYEIDTEGECDESYVDLAGS